MLAFAHISDLHFSDVFANVDNGTTKHQDPHHLELCQRLEGALRDARAWLRMGEKDVLPVVCSGDLTLVGGVEEFAVAHAFLRDSVRMTRQMPADYFGLATPDNLIGSVPGNHDQWRGRHGTLNFFKGVPPYTPSLAGRHFRSTPWWKEWKAPDDSKRLQLFGVDSNSGHSPRGRFSHFQRGSISDKQFKRLENDLATTPRPPGCARAIVCHHSPSYRSWIPAVNRMDRRSQKELRRLAALHGVNAILTGHTHDFTWKNIAANGDPEFWELRAPSTTATQQKDNGFFIHQIKPLPGDRWEWYVWQYLWNGAAFARV
jgi:3',5'-cyclic AMP phosphodiesterase CpdA